MKKLIMTVCSIMLLIGCTNTNSGDLEKRIVELEKSSTVKDKQIEKLTSLSYASLLLATDLDSTQSFKLPKSFGAPPTPKSICEAKCLSKLMINWNICRHVSPQNRAWCENKALVKYDSCMDSCK